MTSDTLKSISTHGYARADMQMSGNRNKELRRQVMLELTGEKLPLAKCGINAIYKTLCDAYNITTGCHAEREERLTAVIDRW